MQQQGQWDNQQRGGYGGGGEDIPGIERGQDEKYAMGWHLYGVKIVLLLFQCRYPEQSLPSKINQQNF
jgi:hypothetical protein